MTAAATFCATLVDEWRHLGVTEAVVCPGSRSTPLALAVADADLRLHVHVDERSAAFVALGLGLASGRPAVVLTTSGTAAVNLHPAVVEADLSGVPMIVCTADRPPELQDRGAPQTIGQTDLYGRAVRGFHDPGVPTLDLAETWRLLARSVFADANGARGRRGPVHLNLPFDEPLVGGPGPLPDHLDDAHAPARPAEAAAWPERLGGRGVMVVGRSDARPESVAALAEQLGWPVLADPRSGLHVESSVVHADVFLRHRFTAEALTPEVVLRVGEAPASRVLNEWLRDCGAHEVVVADRFLDPWRSADEVLVTDVRATLERWSSEADETATGDPGWVEAWRRVESIARREIARLADGDPLHEIGVARTVIADAPAGATIVVSSSMPIRDVEWYAAPRAEPVTVLANRGANGIDGVTSTAVGVALAGGRTVAVLGDIAFLHDSNGLVGLADRGLDLVLVVIDNDGGGIFSFLPQASELAPERFEQLFGTPHGVDLVGLARAHDVDVRRVATRAELVRGLGDGGTRVLVVPSDRTANVALHRRVDRAVAAALEP